MATLDSLTDLTVAAMDAAEPDEGTATEALLRVFAPAAKESERYPALLQRIDALPMTAREDHARHAPVADRIERVIRRGQSTGEFDGRLPAGWLVVAAIHLAHAASEECGSGRMTGPDAEHAFTTSLMRILDPAIDTRVERPDENPETSRT